MWITIPKINWKNYYRKPTNNLSRDISDSLLSVCGVTPCIVQSTRVVCSEPKLPWSHTVLQGQVRSTSDSLQVWLWVNFWLCIQKALIVANFLLNSPNFRLSSHCLRSWSLSHTAQHVYISGSLCTLHVLALLFESPWPHPYAHTPEALSWAVASVHPLSPISFSKILVKSVFFSSIFHSTQLLCKSLLRFFIFILY